MKNMEFLSNQVSTKFISAGGITYAYRTLGENTGVPLVCFQHFTGNMDEWDPLILDGLARNRQVIWFNSRGVASTTGTVPESVVEMANDAVTFITALGLQRVDLLGYSLGGFMAQEIAVLHAGLVRKVMLVATGPRGGEGIGEFPQYLSSALQYDGAERFLYMFFEKSGTSRAKGFETLARLQSRIRDKDIPVSMQVVEAQTKAIANWGNANAPDDTYLKAITQPILVVNGSNDRMFPTINSYRLFQGLPNAQLSLYPDSAHGSLFQ